MGTTCPLLVDREDWAEEPSGTVQGAWLAHAASVKTPNSLPFSAVLFSPLFVPVAGSGLGEIAANDRLSERQILSAMHPSRVSPSQKNPHYPTAVTGVLHDPNDHHYLLHV